MALLSREALLKKSNFKIDRVDLEDDEFVFVKQMSGKERDIFDQSLMKKIENENGDVTFERDLSDYRSKLAVSTMCDEHGNTLLTMEDCGVFSESITAAKLDKITTAAQALNKITEKDKKEVTKK